MTSDFRFTARRIEAIRPPTKGRAFYRDSGTRGLGLMVMPSGNKSFFWQRKARRYPIRKTLGLFPELSVDSARAAADKHNNTLAEWKKAEWKGIDPFQRPQALTLDTLIDEYVNKHLRHEANHPEKAEKAVRWMINKYVPSWRDRRLDEIQHEDVRALHRRLGENHKRTANSVLEVLRAMFNFAARERLHAGPNPALGIKSYVNKKRDRFLDLDELRKLWGALVKADPDLRDYVNLSLWTGARKSDVLSMRWRDVYFSEAKWTVPTPKGGRPYEIPLMPEALEILKARRNDSEWVFPGTGASGHLVEMKRGWRALLKNAKLDYADGSRLRPTQHDLRRSLASHLAAAGTPLLVIAKLLGHASSASVTETYARLDLTPVRQAMQELRPVIHKALKKKAPKALPPAPKQVRAANRA